MGNYKGFGDLKFIPNLPKDKFNQLVLKSEAYQKDSKSVEFLWKQVQDSIYSLKDYEKSLGLWPKVLEDSCVSFIPD